MTETIYPTLTPIDPLTGDNYSSASPTGVPSVEFVLPPYSTGYSPLASQVYVFPFILAANTQVVFNAIHTARERQDYTLYGWFSTSPLVPVLFYSDRVYEISLVRGNRRFGMQDINYSGTCVPNPNINLILAEPGQYYFQIGNRTNATNKFEFVYQTRTLI